MKYSAASLKQLFVKNSVPVRIRLSSSSSVSVGSCKIYLKREFQIVCYVRTLSTVNGFRMFNVAITCCCLSYRAGTKKFQKSTGWELFLRSCSILFCFRELNHFLESSVRDSRKFLRVSRNSKLDPRNSTLDPRKSKLETRASILDSRKLRGSRIEFRVETVNLPLSGTVTS